MTANSTKTKDPWNYVKDGEYWYKEYEKDNIIPIPITTRQEKKTSSDTKLGNGSRCGREDPELTVQVMVKFFISFYHKSNLCNI